MVDQEYVSAVVVFGKSSRVNLVSLKRHFGQQCYVRLDVEKISFREWLDNND
jgi:hypothetical protein